MVASLIYFFVKVAVDHSSIKTTALRWNMDWWMSHFCGNQCVCFLAFPFRGNRKQHCTVDSRGKNCTCFAPLPFSFIGSSVASLPATGGMAKQPDAVVIARVMILQCTCFFFAWQILHGTIWAYIVVVPISKVLLIHETQGFDLGMVP